MGDDVGSGIFGNNRFRSFRKLGIRLLIAAFICGSGYFIFNSFEKGRYFQAVSVMILWAALFYHIYHKSTKNVDRGPASKGEVKTLEEVLRPHNIDLKK